jgi:hypothetical protein
MCTTLRDIILAGDAARKDFGDREQFKFRQSEESYGTFSFLE